MDRQRRRIDLRRHPGRHGGVRGLGRRCRRATPFRSASCARSCNSVTNADPAADSRHGLRPGAESFQGEGGGGSWGEEPPPERRRGEGVTTPF
jgi:hypothetical protein